MNDTAAPREAPSASPYPRLNTSTSGWQVEAGSAWGLNFDLRAILSMLWRRKHYIIGSVVLVMALTWMQLQQVTPRYTAHSKVLVETREANIANVEDVIAGVGGDPASIETQVEVIRSRPLAEKVIKDLSLAQHREFNPSRDANRSWLSYLNPLSYIPASWTRAAREVRGDHVPSVEERLERFETIVVDAFLSKLDVETQGWSRIIDIYFESADPRLAAAVANTTADAYVTNTLEVKFEATQKATKWLNERLSGLRQAVEQSESAVERYRKSAGLIEGQGSSLILEQTSQLSSELVVAQAETARAEARLNQIKKAKSADSVSDVLSSPLILGLKQQLAQLQRRAAELSTEYGDKHPKMVNVRAEIANVHAKINAETSKIIDALRNELEVARAKEKSLRTSLDNLNAKASDLNEAEVELRALQREADANRLLLENFLSRVKETSVQTDIQQPDARIMSMAAVPLAPSYPRTWLVMGGAFVVSVVLGLALVILAEHLDSGVRRSDDLEQLTGLPMLGMVPTLARWSWNKGRPVSTQSRWPQDQVIDSPGSVFTESIRTLHLNLAWTDADHIPKLILITSALPGEGKTSLSMALARTRALSGDKVLLVDCDLRHPQIAQDLDLNSEPGLTDLLFGRAKLEEALQVDSESGCQVITAGHRATNPLDLISSAAMRETFENFRDSYDLVILDSSPLLALSEPRSLARLADTTIVLVRWGKTSRDLVKSAVKSLRDIGVSIAGTVLTHVDLKKQASYGAGQYGQYFKYGQKYYSS